MSKKLLSELRSLKNTIRVNGYSCQMIGTSSERSIEVEWFRLIIERLAILLAEAFGINSVHDLLVPAFKSLPDLLSPDKFWGATASP